MRLLHIFKNPSEGKKFSDFLSSKNIKNELELEANSDWGSEQYGDLTCKLWVIDEDQFVETKSYLEKYLLNPESNEFHVDEKQFSLSTMFHPEEIKMDPKESIKDTSSLREGRSITKYIIILCILVFVYGKVTTPETKTFINYIPALIQFSPQINKDLYYDYPDSFDVIDKISTLYGNEGLEHPDKLPQAELVLLKKALNTPYWRGIYPYIVDYFKTGQVPDIDTTQFFEKIRQGEIWRLFTPALLHHDILHIVFNLLWIYMLGSQIEKKLKPLRYIIFILIAGIVSNTIQYLMSGFNFMGISGIICAMITFIWVRIQYAPWEGYQLEKSTFYFICFFVLSFFTIQLFSFLIETTSSESYSFGIANTAHLVGALVGFIFGRWKKLLLT